MSFFLSKFLWIFFNPFSLILFIFFIGCIFLFFKKYKIANFLLFSNLFFLLFISIFPIGNYAIFILEKQYHNKTNYPQSVHGMLILSGATNPYLSREHNSIELNGSSERLTESVSLINKHKKAKIIFSGGSGYLNNPSLDHSEVAKKFFKKMNIDIGRVIFENKSRNTYENIIFSKQITEINKNHNWIIITSASHMKRAMLVSKKQNWNFYPYAVDFKQPKSISFYPSFNFFGNFQSFQHASHEWLGLVSYYLMGRIERIF